MKKLIMVVKKTEFWKIEYDFEDNIGSDTSVKERIEAVDELRNDPAEALDHYGDIDTQEYSVVSWDVE